jgi:hypothetical protein
MALTDYNEYLDKLSKNNAGEFIMSSAPGRTLRMAATWRTFIPTPATPTTSVVLNSGSDSAVRRIPQSSSGRLTFLGSSISLSALNAGAVILVDLLNANGGLSGIVTTEQTTNFPTAALTRYTSGEGVMAGIVIHTTIGSTASTVTIKYTNSSGVSNRISTVTAFGGSGINAAGSLIPIPLQAGDTGVRSVESVTLAGTTGTAGNFGVYLFKPLAMISMDSTTGALLSDAVSTGGIINSFCEIQPDACVSIATVLALSQSMLGSIIFGEV